MNKRKINKRTKYSFRLWWIGIILLLAFASECDELYGQKWIVDIVRNQYVSGILCSIFAIMIVFVVQNSFSKRKINEDLICNEALGNMNLAINMYNELLEMHNTNEEQKRECEKRVYLDNKIRIKTIFELITYHDSQILIDSLKIYLFSNLDFELLSIINHIKNVQPELEKTWENIDDNREESICRFMLELRYMVHCCDELLSYLGYRNERHEEIMKIYKERYSVEDEISLPAKERQAHYKESIREYRKRKIKKLLGISKKCE